MHKGRLEAFSDGVIAIIITVMILELRTPQGTDLAALRAVVPSFFTYVLSFVFIGIYWNNHHHMLQLTSRVTGGILWANLHLLFWLSLVPFATGWLGQSGLTTWPTAIYGIVVLLAGFAYSVLERTIIASQGKDSHLREAVGIDKKGLASLFLFCLAVGMAFVRPVVSVAIYVLVSVMWLVPDPRIETHVAQHGDHDHR